MVVGVGYNAEFAEFAKLRTVDLTPPSGDAGKAALGGMADLIGSEDGGAEAFLGVLADTLVPEIVRRYPEASTSNHALFGHSLAGLFTAYALLEHPEAFATFLPTSPSLWWDKFAILQRLPAFAQRVGRLERKPRVLVSVGGREQDIPTKVPPALPLKLEDVQAMVAASRMVDAAAEFAQVLRAAGLNEVEDIVFAGEDHSAVVPAAMTRGLAFAVPAPD